MKKHTKLLGLLLILALLCVGVTIGAFAAEGDGAAVVDNATLTPTAADSLSSYYYVVYGSEADFINDIEDGVINGDGIKADLGKSSTFTIASGDAYYYFLKDGITSGALSVAADQKVTVNLGGRSLNIGANNISIGGSNKPQDFTTLAATEFNLYNGTFTSTYSSSGNAVFFLRAGANLNLKGVTATATSGANFIMENGAFVNVENCTITGHSGRNLVYSYYDTAMSENTDADATNDVTTRVSFVNTEIKSFGYVVRPRLNTNYRYGEIEFDANCSIDVNNGLISNEAQNTGGTVGSKITVVMNEGVLAKKALTANASYSYVLFVTKNAQGSESDALSFVPTGLTNANLGALTYNILTNPEAPSVVVTLDADKTVLKKVYGQYVDYAALTGNNSTKIDIAGVKMAKAMLVTATVLYLYS